MDLPSLLLRLLAFEVRIWRAKAWCRSTFPVPVNLKRFCAPLWVFNFNLIFLGLGNSTLQSVVCLHLDCDAGLELLRPYCAGSSPAEGVGLGCAGPAVTDTGAALG